LGIPIQSSFAALGPVKSKGEYEDGSVQYRWVEPPANAGVVAVAAQNGTVLRVWVLNDGRYATKEGLHVGNTEAQVRAVLGDPTRVMVNDRAKVRTLVYDSLGMWFGIQLDQQYDFYDQVFNIGVIWKQ